MLGTLSLIMLIVFGFLQVSPFIIVAFTIINGFLGLHYPAGKAEVLKQRGLYWNVYLSSLPLQALLASIFFFVGYGAKALFS
tara:strand:+ start:18 stop:263 length:246 start_codon:yes stop_codon:yes gene_type:complete